MRMLSRAPSSPILLRSIPRLSLTAVVAIHTRSISSSSGCCSSKPSSTAKMFHSVALPLHFADKVPLALIQLGETSKDKSKNLAHAREYVTKAVQASVSSSSSEKPRMVVLPECWNSPYGVQYFDTYAEDFGGVYEAVKAKIDAERVEAVATSVEEDKVEEVAAQQQKLFEKRWTVDGASPLDVSKSPSETILMMSQLAKELNVVLVGGSIPERDGKTGKLYNTATVFDEQGKWSLDTFSCSLYLVKTLI